MNIESPRVIREIKENLPKHEVAFAFIKPGSVEKTDSIENEIENNGLEIIYRDKINLTDEAIDYIYGDLKDKHFYSVMKDYLKNNEVVVLMVGGKGHEAQTVLSKLKKDGKDDGVLRKKYRTKPKISDEEYSLWSKGEHPEQDKVSVIISQGNVIHTADSVDEALKSLQIIIGQKFNKMKENGNLPAELWQLFEEDVDIDLKK